MAFMTRSLVILGLVAAGCAGEPNAVECKTGISCPSGTFCAAAQPICLINPCGDGLVQTGEICDDGNITDGDGCAANCLSREACGDGVLNNAAGELCDDGNTNSGDGCADDCRSVEVCGNNVRDVNEACDDGNDVPGDGCSGNCKSTEICGNNIVDINEKCDDGGAAGGCNDDCQGGTGCGDAAIDRDGSGNALEECDDGNAINDDDCTAPIQGVPGSGCKLNKCGDGIRQMSGTRVEGCDPAVNFGETAGCNIDCSVAMCGDRKINNQANEECDDGAALNADNRDCTSLCKVNVCGDSLPNTMGTVNPEDCDDGTDGDNFDGCSDACTEPTCGNGIREMGEACDDGNSTNGDGCSGPTSVTPAPCQFESCHDGVVNNGEQCDPGVARETARVGMTPGCDVDCTFSMCNDRIVNVADGEECDDGNANDSGDACRNNCDLNVCGDGSKSNTEECDDGNGNNLDGCTDVCTLPLCPNGVRDMDEECDDGNSTNTDACVMGCDNARCGDGFVWANVEECDEGANNGPGKDCLANCKLNACGDGDRDTDNTMSGTETCDDGNKVDETVCPYGAATCRFCNMNCSGFLDLNGDYCGDGVTQSPEICDDGNETTETTCPYGTASPTTGTCTLCSDDCDTVLTPTGPYCGDGTTQSGNGEACDDRSPTQSCGTCTNGCTVSTPAAKATGIIIAPSGATGGIDGATFTLNDGQGHSWIFEFDTNGNYTAATGKVEIDIPMNSTSATAVREAIEAAIDGTDLNFTTTDVGAAGTLITHNTFGPVGNVAIQTSGLTNAEVFISGMSGGAGRDCIANTPCDSNDDCVSGNCNGSTDRCQ